MATLLPLTSFLTSGAFSFTSSFTRLRFQIATAKTLNRNELRLMSINVDAPLPTSSPVRGGPQNIRYSDFLKLVDADRIEKVTFTADGTKLLGVDVEGAKVKIDALMDDPDLLPTLVKHRVDVTVLPAQEASGLGALAQSLLVPVLILGGLFFLSRRAGSGISGPGGMNPMTFGKSKSQIQLVPDTGITFDD
eukprot:CAMPEP_0172416788 /NCGR_PEP_ID=MMETSP1064-20121228/3286_1 /TAXON_ID=202472 /ORGANISM="Aulacoseira subarctica , Strain CCAP 1002/5" /LENGTH=191 /DNA_ID=CAMNT_0013154685 /DNA_START=157 /DNA_END=729 /DNA_ORIENTATION=+